MKRHSYSATASHLSRLAWEQSEATQLTEQERAAKAKQVLQLHREGRSALRIVGMVSGVNRDWVNEVIRKAKRGGA